MKVENTEKQEQEVAPLQVPDTTTITVTITQSHVDKHSQARLSGEYRSQCCPVAQCLKEMFPDKFCAVWGDGGVVGDTQFDCSYELTHVISRFDYTNTAFTLGTYTLTIVPKNRRSPSL